MNAYRFKQVSLVPQYAMSALNPTRKLGKMMHELLHSRGIDFARCGRSWSGGSSSSG